MAQIFISYRRSDNAAGYSRDLAQKLREHFGDDEVFRDVRSIPPGEVFGEYIHKTLSACSVALIVIGQRWLSEADEDGRRLDDPKDWVRQEVKAALDNAKRVIPILVGKADMPKTEDLPEEIAALVDHNNYELSDRNWDRDVEQLIESLEDNGYVKRTWKKRLEDLLDPFGFQKKKRRRKQTSESEKRKRWVWAAAIIGVAFVVYVVEELDTGEFVAPFEQATVTDHNLNGLWTDNYGRRNTIEQSGSAVRGRIIEGTRLITHQGVVSGQVYNFQYEIRDRLTNSPVDAGTGQLMIAPDGRSMSGSVTNSAAMTEPLQLIRGG